MSMGIIESGEYNKVAGNAVTSEYIRNQNILSDFEAVTIGTSAGAATTMQYDGFLVFDTHASAQREVGIFVNGTKILELNYSTTGNNINMSDCCSIPVKKGDSVYYMYNQAIVTIKARWYKLRDYTGR